MSEKDEKQALQPSTLENIDAAMYEWLDEEVDAFAESQNKGWQKVPVIWTGEERVYQIKEDRDIRDENGALIFPLITLCRSGKTKSLSSKGVFQADIPEINEAYGGSIPFTRRINHKKTSDFERTDAINKTSENSINFQTEEENERIVYETAYIPQPIYLDIDYEITIRTDHRQQMNQIVTPMLNYPGNVDQFLVERNGWKYECFLQENISQEDNITNYDEEERIFKTTLEVETLGYLIGNNQNEEGAFITTKENAVDVEVTEKVVTGSFF